MITGFFYVNLCKYHVNLAQLQTYLQNFKSETPSMLGVCLCLSNISFAYIDTFQVIVVFHIKNQQIDLYNKSNDKLHEMQHWAEMG